MDNTPVIEIRTLESVRNVKDLKDNLVALKAKLADVSTSTEDYADITKELSRNQAALRNVMNGTHSTFEQSIKDAQGLDTSYNSLVQQLKEATQEWRAIPKYLSDADKAQGTVNAAWTEAANKVEVLRTALKDMDATTGSFVRNVGNYKSALDGFNGTMNQVKQVGGDLSNGLQACASTLSLMGYNTDGLTDSMKNLRIVLAAVQGLKGIGGLLKSLGSYFKAGKQAANVTKEMAAAQQANTVATNTATVAMSGFQKALVATGIGALVVALGLLVAHFEEVAEWIGRAGEKLGLWTRNVDESAGAAEKFKDKIEKQNHALENEQKILSAQGSTNKELLIQKKQLVQQQINDTKATIENVKARIAQLEADNKWWKFWQGTRGKIKRATEELKGLEDILNSLNQISTDLDVDITVAGINEGKESAKAAAEAAARAAREEAERLKKSLEIIDEGAKVATAAIRAEETEVEKLDREFEANVRTIQAAIDEMKKLSGVTADVAELENGLVILKQTYYRNRFEAQAAEKSEKIAESLNRQTELAENYETTYREILGLDISRAQKVASFTAAEEKKLLLLQEEKDYLRGMVTISDEVLATLTGLSSEQLLKEFGEPLATAISMYFKKSKETKIAGYEWAKAYFDGFEEEFNRMLESGQYVNASVLSDNMVDKVFEEAALKFPELYGELFPIAYQYYQKYFKKPLSEAILNDEWGMTFKITDILAPQNEIDRLKERINQLKDLLKVRGFLDEEEWQELLTAEENLLQKRLDRWNIFYTQLGKYVNNYGKATANVMSSVADAWEAALQAQVKNGKKSEEQAKKSFKTVKTLQMASAVINTAAAVVQALADPTVPSFYVKIANAAAALAAGTAQVLKISATEFSSNAAASTESTPQLVDRTPQLMYTVGLNPQEYAQAQAQTPIKAYVVDHELADGLDQYNRKRNETTF